MEMVCPGKRNLCPLADSLSHNPRNVPLFCRPGLADYLAWAQLHRGNERNLKHLLKASPYFKSDTDLTSIKSQIIQGEGRD